MYRNKILVIATVLIALLLGVMIWSANVVADHDAQKRNQNAQDNVIGEAIPQEQVKDFEPEEEEQATAPEETEEEQPEEEAEESSPQNNIIIDSSRIYPEISPRDTSISIGRNYLDKVNFSERLILWNTTTFPLSVYIEGEDTLPENFINGIKTAFNNWQLSTDKFITFQYISDPDNANIIVYTPVNAPEGCPGENGIDYKFNIKNNKLINASLTVPQHACNGIPLNARTMYELIQHPLGHILGISVHSPYSSDVMYEETTNANIIITSIDTETLKLLYNFVPTITNKYYSSAEMKKMIRLSQVKNQQPKAIYELLKEHLNAAQDKNDPFITNINTAYEYYQRGKYDKAESSYLEALKNTEDNLEQAYVNRCLSIINIKMNKYDSALNYATTTADISATPSNKYLIAYINFISGNDDGARLRLEEIITKYPKFTAAYPVLAQIYTKQGEQEKLDKLVQQAKENFYEKSPIYYKE